MTGITVPTNVCPVAIDCVRSTDFIQQYIFPGGLLPSPREFRLAAERAGLVVVNELDFGQDYAETLKR